VPQEELIVTGYREAVRALKTVDRDAAKAARAGIKKAAEPISQDVKRRLAGYNEISLGTIGVAVRQSGVSVTQRKKKVTGLRPDFGALQMKKGFIPAGDEGIPLVAEEVTLAIGELISLAGFH
jgi:hypothetical protein